MVNCAYAPTEDVAASDNSRLAFRPAIKETSVFDQVNGLPVHALVLHAAVVFVPLLALGAIVYALVGKWRPKIGWAVAALAVVAPITTFVTKESGEKLFDRLAAQGLKADQNLNDHMD